MRKLALLVAVIGVGLGITSWTSTARADLVTNGGFEDGNFTGWNSSTCGCSISTSPNFIHSGSFGVSFGAVGSNAPLSRTLSTVAGDTIKSVFGSTFSPALPTQ